ncbi:MAG TPA: flagellar hook capping FlgD N-terminal domain-containing protein [Alcaligenes sp.]|nr:flagellar hook capping FlgD N-terminal domain-containing protein [Alcaligenes sp.]HRL25928.1 flagellar hook capping FlgD N-terminal domain-containing protein [Alcaligenes sp.]
MSTVNNVDTSAAAFGMAKAQSKNLMDDTQDRFLTLLVTQLRNQDPLNPMDNAQVTSQIAQMSTVKGITQLNNTLMAVAGQIDVTQSMQAAGMIGKEVLVPGSKIRLGSDANGQKVATPFGVDLTGATSSTLVQVLDSSGKVVREYDLGAKKAGVYALEWDGKDAGGQPLADGAYTTKVLASNDGQAVTAETLTYGKVGSVDYTSGGLKLDLGLAGSYSLLDIRKIM